MWPFCTANSFLWLLLPLLIGLLTGWWAWGRRAKLAYAGPDERMRFAEPPAEPVRPHVTPAAAALTAIGIPAAIGVPDDLLQIKGVGPKLNELLISLGIRRFDQIAAWGAGEIAKVDSHLGAFKGRIERDSWVEQAGLLARGAIAEFETKFGILDSENE